MKSLMISNLTQMNSTFSSQLERECGAKILRMDLAWELFLEKKGVNKEGLLDLPEGNPRTQWFSLNQWMRQTLGSFSNMISQEDSYLIALISPCTSAAMEFIKRSLSIYSHTLGLVQANPKEDDMNTLIPLCKTFSNHGFIPPIRNVWTPPIVNYQNDNPLLEKTRKIQNGGEFTWLGGFLGSERIFAQYYHLHAKTTGNRLHSHSDIDEFFIVLEGNGNLITTQGEFPIKKGDVMTKPGGSGLSTQFGAGDEGLTILDIEVWTRPDQTDVVYYPTHQEVFLRGRGLNYVIPKDNVLSADEMMQNYSKNYQRDKAGKMQFKEE